MDQEIKCALCGDPVEGWRAKTTAPFKFCSGECVKDFVGSFFAQAQSDDRDFTSAFLAEIRRAFGVAS